MAFVAQGWRLTAVLRDRGNNKTVRSFDFVATDTAGDMSALETAATNWLTKYAAVGDLKVSQYSLSKIFVDDAFALSTSPTSEVSTHAEVSGVIYQKPNKTAVVDIPGPKDAIFVISLTSGPDYNTVDVNNADLLAYVGLFTQAGNQFYISDGEQIANGTNARLVGERTHSKSRKG